MSTLFYAKLSNALGISISELVTGEPEGDNKLLIRKLDELIRVICIRIDHSIEEHLQNKWMQKHHV